MTHTYKTYIGSLERDRADLLACLRVAHDLLIGMSVAFLMDAPTQREHADQFARTFSAHTEKIDNACATITALLARLEKGERP